MSAAAAGSYLTLSTKDRVRLFEARPSCARAKREAQQIRPSRPSGSEGSDCSTYRQLTRMWSALINRPTLLTLPGRT